jgi:hypothetical protein
MFTSIESDQIWHEASHSFARGTSDQVRAVLGAVKPDSVYRKIELPELQVNPNVTGIDELYLRSRYPFLSN